jgi:hypothetical protein
MKFLKYLLVLALAICATASVSNAQTVAFLGTGSSALFLELGQAALTSSTTGTPCGWSANSNADIVVEDQRTSPSTNEQGAVWIAWGAGSGTCAAPTGTYSIYAYMSLDSVLGDRCFFEVDSSGTAGCTWSVTVGAGTAGAGLLAPYPSGGETNIPQNVITALNGQHTFVAGTDIRPEDAKFATQRMFTPCNTPILREPYNQTVYETDGLGYGSGNVGTSVMSDFSSKTFHVLQFNITGDDPISGNGVPAYTVNTVGAQPVVVAVGPTPTTGNTGIGAASDISAFTLALFLEGVLGRSTDLVGPTSTNAVTVLVREPLSGTYNTMEFSNPNSSQFKTSQDASNCNSSGAVKSNPLDLASANGAISGAARRRVIGTAEMVSTLQAATTDTLGYFFWSAANAENFNGTNGKYLTVNGVDPLANSYSVTGGTFPTGSSLSQVTFANLNAGDYPIWSALRLVTNSPAPAGVTNLITAAQSLNSTQSDFIPLSKLKVWHSHFNIYGVNVFNEANGFGINTPGDLCPTSGAAAEGGGDAGGTNVTVAANSNFCSDFGSKIGLVNKNN